MAPTAPAVEFSTTLSSTPVPAERRAEILAAPGFGTTFTDHMVTAVWTPDAGWHDAGLRPYAPLSLDPATAVLHYAQSIFEGLKAYRHDDDSIWAFRPEANAARFQRSAARMALPELPVEAFVESIDLLVGADAGWVPGGGETSLYLRPFMFASEVFLGVRPANHVTYGLIASPAGAYFASGVKPVSIWLSAEYTRAAPGGTGAAKCAGNYAASLVAQQEAIANGCDQVCFLDALERKWVEELGGMNLYFVRADGSITTPSLTGTILEGVTRDSIITLAGDLHHKVEERPVSIDEWRDGVASGEITEVFACGTAAVVTPLGRLAWNGGELHMGDEPGPVTQEIRTALLDLQYGRAEDKHAWMRRLV
ncbi:branched-chain amino acid aminotransferase [Phytoactinopolyspora alkaliphila]|uniref:Branched-chain-amino-acid aminotransferase n=1 Tax=Phytoactinopolyspora alkaliphila TaxID=1783498 RepID=A0A6N9YT19_9ACTN|nr:branched-chain amino acid aminotransferase [Phytoactinopolyspora alkaliphila]NED97959.1 branched-chain amino acid aminotransferase [Phytoactinopolyspora alkaliphila]